jgi:two-component system response regulator
MTSRAPQVLMVEDDDDFVALARLAFRKAELSLALTVATNGEEAISHLKNGATHPALVLLDLKLPKVSGIEVLRWIRSEHSAPALPVVMLTSSGEDGDRGAVAELGANDYCVKPHGFSELVVLFKKIAGRWLPDAPSTVR